MSKFVVRQPSTGWASLAWSLAVLLAFLLAGCQPRGLDPCAPNGCVVPGAVDPVAEYVALCRDVDDHTGPCVDQVGDSGMWIYVAQGSPWPRGVRLAACDVESGGPVPCVWVPSAMGNGHGDAGAYVYRTGK